MADYTGTRLIQYVSSRPPCSRLEGKLHSPLSGFLFTSLRARSGTYSLEVRRGGSKSIPIGCEAGATTISVYAYPASSGCKAVLVIMDPETMEHIDSDASIGDGDWEELSVSFSSEKKIYKAILYNQSPSTSGLDNRTWFDDLTYWIT